MPLISPVQLLLLLIQISFTNNFTNSISTAITNSINDELITANISLLIVTTNAGVTANAYSANANKASPPTATLTTIISYY